MRHEGRFSYTRYDMVCDSRWQWGAACDDARSQPIEWQKCCSNKTHPKVVPWSPIFTTSAILSFIMMAPIGTPFASGLAIVITSGWQSLGKWECAHILPVRPRPHYKGSLSTEPDNTNAVLKHVLGFRRTSVLRLLRRIVVAQHATIPPWQALYHPLLEWARE